MARTELSPAQQDYLEALYRLASSSAPETALRALQRGRTGQGLSGVRITDLAAALGTRLPTVVRTVARLRELGLVEQEQRGQVHLTADGLQLAAQLAHRHSDVVYFLYAVLGVTAKRAEAEACLIEHGLSAETAQRLHLFLERWDALSESQRSRLSGMDKRVRPTQFTLLGEGAGAGGRG
ncbi:metal-dependent transcriptional regulator [bacterium]|nr:metal-dependent transcriptional regulator [bacterium]